MNKYIDLHLHLDGSLSKENIKQLCRMQSLEVPSGLESLLCVPKDCHDLNEYLRCFDFPLTLLQSEDAIVQSIITLCHELKELSLEYAEIRFAPQLHTRNGLTQKRVIEAACQAINLSDIDARLILCTMRGRENMKANEETVGLTAEFLGNGVCALDLAGAEALFPTRDFKHLFEFAAKENIPYTIHAGEADGADSVIDAINMGASRIGHGVRAYEEERAVKMLTEYNIPLEICPTSNLNTRVFKDIHDFPIPYFIEKGVIVTINSDNMSVSDTNVKKELSLVCSSFGINKEIFINNALKSRFI